MISKILILVIVGAIAQAQSSCINCGLGRGKDVCAHHCSTMVVRPAKLPKIDITDLCKPRVVCKQVGVPPLKPIGDLCCCNRAIVTPAIVPKPVCPQTPCSPCSAPVTLCSASSTDYFHDHSHVKHEHTHYHGSSGPTVEEVYAPSSSSSSYAVSGDAVSSAGSASSSSATSYAPCGPSGDVVLVDAYGIPQAPAASGLTPADPVSLALAYKLQNTFNKVDEDKLSFGFRTMPKEIKICKETKTVFPEENLYGINGQIVELKPSTVQHEQTVDEEAVESLLHTDEEQEGVVAVKKLTYDEIGFGPEKVKEVPYVRVEGHVDTGSIGSRTQCAKPCNDCYVPGKVIIEPVRKHEVCIQTTGDDYEDDGSYSEEDDEYVPYSRGIAVHYPAYGSSYSSSSSSSSASSSSSSHHNIFIEKLKCS